MQASAPNSAIDAEETVMDVDDVSSAAVEQDETEPAEHITLSDARLVLVKCKSVRYEEKNSLNFFLMVF